MLDDGFYYLSDVCVDYAHQQKRSLQTFISDILRDENGYHTTLVLALLSDINLRKSQIYRLLHVGHLLWKKLSGSVFNWHMR